MSATAILKLERAGFTREQVEALAEYLDDQLAKKADLKELELRLGHRITEVQNQLEHRMAEMQSQLDHSITEFRTQLRHEIAVESGPLRLWMVAQVFVIVGVLGTLGYFR